MLATSTDGLTFTRLNEILTDQGDVPDVVQDSSGRIYVYYTGWTVGNELNKTCVAISDDNGETWIYKKVVFNGFDQITLPVDPDIQILSNGTFRLYGTSDPGDGDGPRTYYMEGTDGITFTKKGVSFTGNNTEVLDPSTVLIGDTWHIYSGGVPQNNQHGVSSDGKTFTYEGLVQLVNEGKYYLLDNGLTTSNGCRYYCFSEMGDDIKSFVSSDGTNFTVESGKRLEGVVNDDENGMLLAVAVWKLKNGKYLMIYATKIPD